MTNISKTIIFFGTDNFSLITLQGLVKAGYNITAVVTKPDSKSGRGQIMTPSVIKKFAQNHQIEVWQPTKISEINEKIIDLNAEVIGVLASFGKIIPKSTIELFTPGIINIHPSLLPKYRGPSPIESAITNGDKETGVTIMKLIPEMDAGPIYDQQEYILAGTETSPELYNKLAEIGTNMLIKLLPDIMNDSILLKPQDETKTTYCDLLTKEDAWLKPSQLTADQAERSVRAHLLFPKTKYIINNYQIIIIKSHVSKERITALDIKCRDNNFLIIDQLVAPSGKTVSSKDFINGYKLI